MESTFRDAYCLLPSGHGPVKLEKIQQVIAYYKDKKLKKKNIDGGL